MDDARDEDFFNDGTAEVISALKLISSDGQ